MAGYFTVGRFRGAPIRLHWTLPLGAFVWGGFRFVPAYWLGFALLILIHELGHALIVVQQRLGLSEIVLHGAGGYCAHQRSGTALQEATVAWGGVLAQLALLLGAEAWLLLAGPPTSNSTALLAYVLTTTNTWLICLNLLPIEPLDGRKAWPLFPMLLRRLRRAPGRPGPSVRPEPAPRSVHDALRDLEQPRSRSETPSEKTDRIVRDLIARTTQPKDR